MRSLIICVVTLVGILDYARAWDAEGHRIIARIAGQLLSPKTARFVRHHLPSRPGTFMSPVESALVDASGWADNITSEYPWSADLHFSHTPYRSCSSFDFDRDCGSEGSRRCIVSAIANYTLRAADIDLPVSERAEAIKFLVHFVGDSHQGLHVGFRRDRGGTRIPVGSTDALSLHDMWDTSLLESHKATLEEGRDATWYAIAAIILDTIGPESRKRHQLANPVMSAADAFPISIVSETSTTITCQQAYQHETGAWIESNDELSEEYMISRRQVVLDQFAKAGVRLAQLLNSVATAYYQAERERDAAALSQTTGGAGRATPSTSRSNRFEVLSFESIEFDPYDFVYELPAAVNGSGAAASDIAPTTPPTTGVPRRIIDGIDIDELVLVEQNFHLLITYGHLVGHHPPGLFMLEIAFLNGNFIFNVDIRILVSHEAPSAALLLAMFQHFKSNFRFDHASLPDIPEGQPAAEGGFPVPILFLPRVHLYAKLPDRRLVNWIDVHALVLIKRDSSFIVTASYLVTSESYRPKDGWQVWVRFKDGAPLAFALDGDAFFKGMPPGFVLKAIFSSLKGLPFKLEMSEALDIRPDDRADPHHPILTVLEHLFPPGEAGAAADPSHLSKMYERRSEFASGNWVDFSTIASSVRPRKTPEELRAMYGGSLPAEEQRINDIISSQSKGLVIISFASTNDTIILISTYDLLVDRTQTRFVFNKYTTQAGDEEQSIDYVYVDARFVDDPLPDSFFASIPAMVHSAQNMRLIRKLDIPSLGIVGALGAITAANANDEDHVSLGLIADVQSVRRIRRPGSHLRTVEIVLRTPADRLRVSRILGISTTTKPAASTRGGRRKK